MKIRILLLLILIGKVSLAQWKTTTPYGITINDITFTDRYTGYAVFQAQGTGSCMTTLSCYKTIDEGNTWIKMNTGTTNTINAVHFVNSLTGWIAASSSEIRKTTDGGVSWVQQNFGVGSGYNDIWFKDINNGFVIGNSGLLRKSTNGGSTWQTITSGVTANLRRIFFVNNNNGFIGCGNGQILRTTNGGTSWSAVTTGVGAVNDIFFTSANVGFIVGSNSLYTTQNGGISWTLSSLVSGSVLLRIYFSSPLVGYIITDGQGILRTTDGGNTWTHTYTMNGSSDSWKGIYFIDDNTGYICGSLGKIDKTTDGGRTWKNMVSGLGQELFTVAAPHKDTAYTGSSMGNIFKTQNGGITYFQQAKAFTSRVNKLYFLNPATGFACSDSGRIMKTTDGGNHWNLVPTNSIQTVTDFSFINFQQGFASGGGGVVFKTMDNGNTWDTIQTGVADDFKGIWFTTADTGYVISSSKIVNTFDGGITWTVFTPLYSGSLTDIVFTNHNLGYCAGGFGKFMKTLDAGIIWDTINPGTYNAEINEMWAKNDSILYFARYGSQSITTDSCKHLSTLSTACLANNWSMNSIAMTDGGNYGYSVGGLAGVIHQLEMPEIIAVRTSLNAYCPGSTIFVEYDARGFYGTGNVFTAQLSDNTGSFNSPVNIGTYTTLHMIYQAGIITATLPTGIPAGNYRVRVTASNPAVISPDNGYDILIQNPVTPSVSLHSNIPGTSCYGETFVLSAIPVAGGLNPSYQWSINGNSFVNPAANYISDTLHNGDSIQVTLISDLACASPNTALSNTYVVSIAPPPIFSLGNDTAVCQHSVVELNGPSGYVYQWMPSTGLNDPTIANPVATISASINYRLKITDNNGCSYTDTINILAHNLPPDFNLANDTAVCLNSFIPLNAPAGYNYGWNTTAGLNDSTIANPIAHITTDIIYHLVITDTNGCINSDSVAIQALPVPPAFNLGNDTAVCTQNIIQLYAPNGYMYHWNPTTGLNDTTIFNPTVNISNSMTYSLTISNIWGCTQSDTISFTAWPLPEIPVINFDSNKLTTSQAYAYQWYLDSIPIIGATDSIYIPLEDGDYTVVVWNEAGCSNISQPYSVLLVGIQSQEYLPSFMIYPNPVKDLLRIQCSHISQTESLDISILDLPGRILFHKTQILSDNTKEIVCPVNYLSKGIYICRLQVGNYGRMIKFVK